MTQLQYALLLIVFLSMLGSVTSLSLKPPIKPPIKYTQIKAPGMEPRFTPESPNGPTSSKCFGSMAGASTVEGGIDRCDTSDSTSSIHIEKADIILMPEQYRRSLNSFNKLALDNKISPMALESRLKQDPEALLAIINLPSEERSAAAKKFGRLLAQENPGQRPLSKALKVALLSVPQSKRAARDNKNIEKWWKEVLSKSTKKGKALSFEADDEEGVGRIVGYIARKSFGKLLDFLDDDPYYGLHPDKDDIPKSLLSRTTERKQLPAIFKGDPSVSIIQANFYAARKVLYSSKDGKN
ncbi:hypothetical protein NCS52_00465600 [Fusarium sp. LHS14.1]|nr:hypothetical protein NCS52_00465600 [Fusarium sp. LHS14.1]